MTQKEGTELLHPPWVCHPSSISMCSPSQKLWEPHHLGFYGVFIMRAWLIQSSTFGDGLNLQCFCLPWRSEGWAESSRPIMPWSFWWPVPHSPVISLAYKRHSSESQSSKGLRSLCQEPGTKLIFVLKSPLCVCIMANSNYSKMLTKVESRWFIMELSIVHHITILYSIHYNIYYMIYSDVIYNVLCHIIIYLTYSIAILLCTVCDI